MRSGPPSTSSSAAPSWFRRRRPSLLTRFAWLSLLVVIALGVGLGAVLQRTVEERALTDAIRTAEVAANIGVLPQLSAQDLERDFAPLSSERVAALDGTLATSLSQNGVVRLKIWNRQHWLVYSDNPALRRRWFPGNDLLNASFDGRTVSQITDLSAPEELEERDFGRLLAVYVPLRTNAGGSLDAGGDGEIVGAFEIYLPYQPIAAAIASDTRQLYLTLALGLGLLYLVLYRLVARASRTLRRQSAENEHQALHDSLTDLPNRRLFQRRVDEAVALDHIDRRATAVMLLDLDRFKEINDALGHEVGDRLLCAVGERLVEHLGPRTVIARLGGDEFAILAGGQPLTADVAVLDRLGRSVLRALEGRFVLEGLELEVRGSVGIAVAPLHGDGAASLIRRADVAMYTAKRARSEVEVYAPEEDVFDAERLALAAEVRRAIDCDELVVFFQPKVHLASGRALAAEALVRWQHPQRGLVGPGEFMPVVETTELIKPLTLVVLDKALGQLRELLDAGWGGTMAVNVAASSLSDATFPEHVAAALVHHGISPEHLELELTETSLLGDPRRVRRVLDALSDMGLELSVDDFGTGYASLAYLTELPVGVLKVDQSFVRDLADPHNLAVTRYSIELGHTLGLVTVAEGVEDATTLEVLRDLGCDQVQGYHFSRPLPGEQFVAWLTERGELRLPAPISELEHS